MSSLSSRLRTVSPWTWLFALVCAVVSAVVVVPWTTAGLVPAMDYPAHLALVNALHHVGDAQSVLGQHFVAGTFPAPNSLFYILTYVRLSIPDPHKNKGRHSKRLRSAQPVQGSITPVVRPVTCFSVRDPAPSALG